MAAPGLAVEYVPLAHHTSRRASTRSQNTSGANCSGSDMVLGVVGLKGGGEGREGRVGVAGWSQRRARCGLPPGAEGAAQRGHPGGGVPERAERAVRQGRSPPGPEVPRAKIETRKRHCSGPACAHRRVPQPRALEASGVGGSRPAGGLGRPQERRPGRRPGGGSFAPGTRGPVWCLHHLYFQVCDPLAPAGAARPSRDLPRSTALHDAAALRPLLSPALDHETGSTTRAPATPHAKTEPGSAH